MALSCALVLHVAASRNQAAWVVPFALLWGWGLAWRLPRASTPSSAWLFTLALGLRALFIGTPTLLSDDLYRYVWEGALLNAGGNPFTTPPAQGAGVLEGVRALVNHPEYSSIYPPLAQWWFRLLAAVNPSPAAAALTAQAATACVDALTVPLLAHALRKRGLPAWPALAWALHPLPVLCAAQGAHLESVAMPFLALAAAAPPGRAAYWLWLGGGIKLLPLVALPAALRRGPAPALFGSLLGLLTITLAAVPVLSAGPAMFTSFHAYAQHWSFNGLLYPWMTLLFGQSGRSILLLTGLAYGLYITLTVRDLPRVALAIGAAFIALTPTAHPWYGLWALMPAMLCADARWLGASTALLGADAVLFAWDPATQGWTEPAWLWPLVWLPWLAALLQPRSEPSPVSE